ncbi:MAG: membrane fusion protein (multidrug efflux system) [Gammaproteobacteria bacterium]|jgi:membrane fusion protein (multidrug efflux system)
MRKSIKQLLSIILFASLLLPTIKAAEESVSQNNELNDIRGLVKPVTSATLSSEIVGRIIKLPFKLGGSFKKGQILVQFDCSLYNAELAAANAHLEAEQKKYENNLQLLALNAISKIEVDISAIDVKKADAEKQIAAVRVQRCVIHAPYDGRVIDTAANAYESVGPDQGLLSILSDKQLEIELIVPSSWLTWLQMGVEFQFLIDETGKDYKAKVAQLGASVDPVSQTLRVIGIFTTDTAYILSGMSGTAKFREPGN